MFLSTPEPQRIRTGAQLRPPVRRRLRPLLRPGRARRNLRSPALDVSESERAYTVKLDLPGVAKEDVKIAIDGRRVSVEAQTAQGRGEEGRRARRLPRALVLASYARSFSVAADSTRPSRSAKLEQRRADA